MHQTEPPRRDWLLWVSITIIVVSMIAVGFAGFILGIIYEGGTEFP